MKIKTPQFMWLYILVAILVLAFDYGNCAQQLVASTISAFLFGMFVGDSQHPK